MGSLRRAWLATALGLSIPIVFLGQAELEPRLKTQPKEDTDTPRPNLRIDTNVVLIPVAVNDPLNRPVSGLEKKNFKIYDDKVEQSIVSFAMENEPIAMCLVF